MKIPPLRQLRQKQGYTLREFADWSGVDFTALSRIERGQRSPSVPILLKIIRGLGLFEFADLLEPWATGPLDR